MENKSYKTKTFFVKDKKIKGVGDWIEEKVTKPLGIKKTVEVLTNAVGIKDCGCNKRKQQLNNLFPLNKEK